MRRCSLSIAAFGLAVLLGAGIARADEFKLKDGSTIVGSVVGYVGNSFKVKTSYGYALVEKDKIVSIRISTAQKSSSSENKAKPEARKTSAATNRASKSSGERDAKGSAVAATAQSGSPTHAANSVVPAKDMAGASSATEGPGEASQAAQTGSTIASVPYAADQPQPIQEKVTGNTYINETYQFKMYKPPDWQVMDGARSVLPGATAAMGTDDQRTYLVVGQQPAGESATADSAAMEKRLSDILVNFRPLGDEHLTVSGEPVIAHRFRGSLDEHDWSGFMVFLPHGAKVYTIFGMTRADNDLVQIQENVIRRTISSFQFLPH